MKWLSDEKLNYLRTVVVNPDFSSTKYTFIKELGSGGMGTVYLAEDRELNRLIAIKVLNTLEVTEDLRNRMVREAQIIAGLEHPTDVGGPSANRELRDDRQHHESEMVHGLGVPRPPGTAGHRTLDALVRTLTRREVGGSFEKDADIRWTLTHGRPESPVDVGRQR